MRKINVSTSGNNTVPQHSNNMRQLYHHQPSSNVPVTQLNSVINSPPTGSVHKSLNATQSTVSASPNKSQPVEIICIDDSDSDSETDKPIPPTSDKPNTSVLPNAILPNATPVEQSLTTTTSSAVSSINPQSSIKPISNLLAQKHSSSEAAVAKALANFIQFQKQLCRTLQSEPTLPLTHDISTGNELTQCSLLPVTSTSTLTYSDSGHFTTTNNSTVHQSSVNPSQLSLLDSLQPRALDNYLTPSNSEIANNPSFQSLVNGLQHYSVLPSVSGTNQRKTAIVTPISHRPPIHTNSNIDDKPTSHS